MKKKSLNIDVVKVRIELAIIVNRMAGGQRYRDMKCLADFVGIPENNWEFNLRQYIRQIIDHRQAQQLLNLILGLSTSTDAIPTPQAPKINSTQSIL